MRVSVRVHVDVRVHVHVQVRVHVRAPACAMGSDLTFVLSSFLSAF